MSQVIGWREIKSAGSCRYDAVALGEVMLRFDPRDVPVARMRDAVRVAKRAAAGLGVKASR